MQAELEDIVVDMARNVKRSLLRLQPGHQARTDGIRDRQDLSIGDVRDTSRIVARLPKHVRAL